MTKLSDQMRAEASALARDLGAMLEEAILGIDARAALPTTAKEATGELIEDLPDRGCGAEKALERLLDLNARAGANVGGPRCFHFVIGGSTPAALGADLLATTFETLTYSWVVSPLGVHMELRALRWLRELFGLPLDWSGVMVTGGTMANFVGLAAGRQWWGECHGFDVSESGMAGKPAMPVITSGYVHAAMKKCFALQGIGRSTLQICARDSRGRVDLTAFERALVDLGGAPAFVVLNAGEVNAGDFDPIAEMMEIARQHNTWVHVDGAFGLFARVSPRVAHLVEGVERADSVAVDGHKWLNVPYDSGYAFVRDHGVMARAFRYTADYLPREDDPEPVIGAIAPESSRRGRAFAVWATLLAYGREGYQHLVEHCLDLAQSLAARVDREAHLERMAEVPLNIVAFRYRRDGLTDERLDRLNQELGRRMLADGSFLVGTSKLAGRTIFRPAFSNWRTRETDVEDFVDMLLEIGDAL